MQRIIKPQNYYTVGRLEKSVHSVINKGIKTTAIKMSTVDNLVCGEVWLVVIHLPVMDTSCLL
jgi:hypothetical protein